MGKLLGVGLRWAAATARDNVGFARYCFVTAYGWGRAAQCRTRVATVCLMWVVVGGRRRWVIAGGGAVVGRTRCVVIPGSCIAWRCRRRTVRRRGRRGRVIPWRRGRGVIRHGWPGIRSGRGVEVG